ncbi:MAG: Rrf2 family transcriptional regulator [Candidatus Omnitrophica bacterium]|nr:Rrf2 family transcriptional regulator [Candidatus Omnitrophota bacterium]
MRISAKSDYACKAILELALNWPHTEPLQIGVIAERQNIPLQFLTQILINLKQLGYTQSVRGKKGGYKLAVAPRDIRLGELIRKLEQEALSSIPESERHGDDIMLSVWREVDQAMLNIMDKINFESLADRKRTSDNTIMFEI